jgi:hypothetical protein
VRVLPEASVAKLGAQRLLDIAEAGEGVRTVALGAARRGWVRRMRNGTEVGLGEAGLSLKGTGHRGGGLVVVVGCGVVVVHYYY